MRELVYNAIQCRKCMDIIESLSRHDYKCCSCGSVCNDGGLDYQHITGNKESYVNLAVYSDNDFKIVREYAYRTGYGKLGNLNYGTFRLTKFKDMTNEHLDAALDYLTEQGIIGEHFKLLVKEKQYRVKYNINIEEHEQNTT